MYIRLYRAPERCSSEMDEALNMDETSGIFSNLRWNEANTGVARAYMEMDKQPPEVFCRKRCS